MFTRALQTDPMNTHSWRGMGVELRELGNLDSSLTCLRIADALIPNNYATVSHLGITYLEMCRYDHAEQAFRRATELNPADFYPWSMLLGMYKTLGRTEAIRDLLDSSLAHNDGDMNFDCQLGDYFLHQRDFEAAAVAYRRALTKQLDTAFVRLREQQFPQLRVLP